MKALLSHIPLWPRLRRAIAEETMRLSPGYGTVKKISARRTNPYAVHPPTVNGIRPKALCYVPGRETGIAVLKLYHNGQYNPGMEKLFKKEAVKVAA